MRRSVYVRDHRQRSSGALWRPQPQIEFTIITFNVITDKNTPITSSFHLDCFQEHVQSVVLLSKKNLIKSLPYYTKVLYTWKEYRPAKVRRRNLRLAQCAKVDNPDSETQPLGIIFNYPDFFVMNIRPQFQCRCSAQIYIKSGKHYKSIMSP